MTEYKLDLSDINMTLLFPPKEYPITTQQAFQHALTEIVSETYEDPSAANFGGAGVLQSQSEAATISIDQSADTLDWDAVERWNLEIGRRLSIGFGHYHHEQQLVYAMGLSRNLVAEQFDSFRETMAAFKEPIQTAINRMGVNCSPPEKGEGRPPLDRDSSCLAGSLNAYTDLTVGEKKISTNIMHLELPHWIWVHGTIEYTLRPKAVLDLFNIDATEDQFRERITSINEQVNIGREEAASILEETLSDWTQTTETEGQIRNRIIERAEQLDDEKYSRDSWIKEEQEMSTEWASLQEILDS